MEASELVSTPSRRRVTFADATIDDRRPARMRHHA
jgi:hypothetical protein